jgi:hypothetical protein
MRNRLLAAVLAALLILTGALHAQSPTQPLYQLPDRQSPVVTGLASGTGIQLLGRYDGGGWLYISVNDSGLEGWLPETAISTGRDYSALPERSIQPEDVLYNLRYWNFTPKLKPVIERGQQAGFQLDYFSKVGDSITVNKAFMQPFADGVYALGDEYAYLQTAIDYFGPRPDGGLSPFALVSSAAGVGWTTRDLLSRANDARCFADDLRLTCEYRLTRPASALIMVGTNDAASLRLDQYDANLRRIVELSLNMGVVPILSTLPQQPERAEIIDSFNLAIVRIAADYDVPLVNYWLATRGLPGGGLSTDGIHPSAPPGASGTTLFTPENLQYGYTVRNLMSLHALYYLLTQVVYAA